MAGETRKETGGGRSGLCHFLCVVSVGDLVVGVTSWNCIFDTVTGCGRFKGLVTLYDGLYIFNNFIYDQPLFTLHCINLTGTLRRRAATLLMACDAEGKKNSCLVPPGKGRAVKNARERGGESEGPCERAGETRDGGSLPPARKTSCYKRHF